MRKGILLLIPAFVLLLAASSTAFAQTGKISGQVVSAESGEPIPGANVVIVGTQQGTSTNPQGQYTILNVAPGTYDLRASFVGYESQTVQGVEVNIDLTTTVNFELPEETVGLEGVTVTAGQRVVKEDLSASRVDVSAEDIENLPVSDVESVVGLQAGVQGLQIRGSEADEADVRIDGASMSSGRDNSPYTGFSYTSVQEVQVQSGGFNAEYGNIRSGVVNVVTREGPRDHYEADVLLRYSPASKKHFGVAPNDPESYWMRPYLDSEVAFEGTDNWDEYTQQQYPEFDGFNEIAAENSGLNPEQAQELFEWRHRRDISIQSPDYVVDGSVGGPVPGISQYLGDLRFMASYRQEQEQYIVPLSRDGYDAYNARLKLTSNITPTMKLTLQGMRGGEKGSNQEGPRTGPTRIRRDGNVDEVSGYGNGVFYDPGGGDGGHGIFGTGLWSQSDIQHRMFAAKLNHTVSDNTFYEFQVQRYKTSYRTYPEEARDPAPIRTIGGLEVNEAPIGFSFESDNSLTGMRMGAHHSEFRDTSDVAEWRASFDITSQLGQYNEAQAGFEFSVEDQDINYQWNDFLLNPGDNYTSWTATPIYGAAYVQDKLEFKGMIANVGLRLDYFDPNAERYVFPTYPEAFLGKNKGQLDEMLEQEPVDPKISLSPRLGVSFPIVEGSKIYFNYGHFYQELAPDMLYNVEREYITDSVVQIANPDVPRPKTTAYELGYEQSLFDQYLVRIAGYYKDIQNQPRWVSFQSRDGLISYTTNFAENYEDIRGVEFSLYKNVGDWFQGFVNYTYDVRSQGDFGFGTFYENRVQQREYERTTTDYYQSKPQPQPFARISLTFLTPSDYGPEVGGVKVLGDWRINLLGQWQAGEYETWTNQLNAPTVENNLQWKGYRMVDMRLSKNLSVDGMAAQLFADIDNVLNIKNLNQSSFFGPNDYQNYVNSLHLPKEAVEGWEQNYEPRDENGDPIYGDDQLGDIDGDHIDPPNGNSFRYLFPRSVTLGMRFSF